MASVAVGGRVGAIRNGDGKTTWIYGYGVRLEDSVPPESVGGFNLGISNPTLKMDDGTVVYGCECWWGPEEKIRERIKDTEVVTVQPEREEVVT